MILKNSDWDHALSLWWEQNCFDQFAPFTSKQGIVVPSGLIGIWHGPVSQLSVWRSVSPLGIAWVSRWWPLSPCISIPLTTTLPGCFYILFCAMQIPNLLCFCWDFIKLFALSRKERESEFYCNTDVSLLRRIIGFGILALPTGQRTDVILMEDSLKCRL